METILDYISEKEVAHGGRIMAATLSTKDIVTIQGSVLGGWDLVPFDKQESVVMFARLLDAGTSTRSKDELRHAVAERGATLSFSSGASRTYFDASCLPEDLPFMLSLIAECLSDSVFDQKELDASRARLLTSISNSSTDTRGQAGIQFQRTLYDKAHPNYSDTNEERTANLAKVTRADLVAFQKHVGCGGLVLAMTGDIKAASAIRAAEAAFATLAPGTLTEMPYARNKKPPKAAEKRISIPGKASIDVYIGMSLPFTYDDPEYRPLLILADLLGGSFSGHLMETIRERDGLTYGVYAGMRGISKRKDGYFRVWSMFAPELYEKGIAAIQAETNKFLARGITEKGIASKKEELEGSYLIGLSTTGGLAAALHTIGTRHQPLSQLVAYVDQVQAVTLAQVKRAASFIRPELFSIVAAGTFDKKK